MILLRIAVVAVALALVGPVLAAENCDTDPACRAARGACPTAACDLRTFKRCERKGIWIGCHTKGVRQIECETSCGPAIQADCQGSAKCRRKKLKGCMLVGPATVLCSTTTTTTSTQPAGRMVTALVPFLGPVTVTVSGRGHILIHVAPDDPPQFLCASDLTIVQGQHQTTNFEGGCDRFYVPADFYPFDPQADGINPFASFTLYFDGFAIPVP